MAKSPINLDNNGTYIVQISHGTPDNFTYVLSPTFLTFLTRLRFKQYMKAGRCEAYLNLSKIVMTAMFEIELQGVF